MSDVDVVEAKGESLSTFVNMLTNYPAIFDKSMLPEARQKKAAAFAAVREKYERGFGIPMSESQLIKKLSNMKTRLKKKTDLRKTGNKPIQLADWEHTLYTLLNGDSNPAISRAEGGITCGVVTSRDGSSCETQGCAAASTWTGQRSSAPEPPARSRSRSSSAVLDRYETDETRRLSVTELQRLVLLEQLAALREQREYYKEKRECLSRTNNIAQNVFENTPEEDGAVLQQFTIL